MYMQEEPDDGEDLNGDDEDEDEPEVLKKG